MLGPTGDIGMGIQPSSARAHSKAFSTDGHQQPEQRAKCLHEGTGEPIGGEERE